MTSQKRLESIAKWQNEKTVVKTVRFNKDKDDALLRWLEQVPNISSYIKNLINKDIDETLKR